MIAIDTNILVYAHRSDSAFHETADRAVRAAEKNNHPILLVFWPSFCVAERVTYSNMRPFPRPRIEYGAGFESGPKSGAIFERLFISAALTKLAESGELWAIPWPCIHEFLAIVTHPKIYDPPTPIADALEQVECWLEVPTLILLGEDKHHWTHLRSILEQGSIIGPMIHDARVAALCTAQDVHEIWTADRDFEHFSGTIKAVNPLRND